MDIIYESIREFMAPESISKLSVNYLNYINIRSNKNNTPSTNLLICYIEECLASSYLHPPINLVELLTIR